MVFSLRLLMLQGNPPAAVSGPPTSSTSSRLSSAKNPSLPPSMAMQDDFAAAKYHTSIAVYCGSVPKFKPRYKALRGGSIDSDLQFCGCSWTTEEEASFQSILTIEMKKQLKFWDEDGDGDVKSNATPSLDGCANEADVRDFSTGQGGDHPHLSRRALTQDLREREASSAAPGTIQIKDKLKTRRMSVGLSASYRGLTDCNDPKGVTLKPVVSRSPPQELQVTSETMSPIQNRPISSESSMLSDKEQENEENDTEYNADDENNMELMSERKGYKASLLHSYCSGDDGNKSRRVTFLPPILKPARPSAAAPSSTVVPLPDLVSREEMRSSSRSRSEEKTFKSRANSLPAIAQDSSTGEDEPECRDDHKAKPYPNPQKELLNALTWLSSDDWEEKEKGLISIRCLPVCNSEVLLPRLHDVSLAVTKEVNNLRSKVCCCAIKTLGELFRTMKKDMDHEVDEIARVLLQRMGDSNEFIQRAASQSLGIMARTVTPARAMTALMASGVQHRNVLVRKTAAEHLLTVVERIGAKKLLSGIHSSTEALVCTLVKLAQDSHQDTRYYGRTMLNLLITHPKFDSYLKKSAPSRDLEDIMAMIKQKGTGDHQCEPPSAKKEKNSKKNVSITTPDDLPSNGGSGSDVPMPPSQTARKTARQTARQTAHRTSQEELQELCKLLTAKDFQPRMKGVLLLLDHCKSNPQLISTNIAQIFDVFVLRLQDCNKKVNQQALEALALMTPILREALHPVLASLVAAVIENLNSKHSGIYAAAVKVLEACIKHLDNTSLLQIFAHRVCYLSGQALLDVIERLSVLAATLYPRKPQTIERYVLPALWFLLGNKALPVRSNNVRAVLTKLAKALDQVMGPKLKKYATNQPWHVIRNLWDLLDLNMKA